MKNTPTLQANEAAERIVQYFQANGFAGISEALVIRIRLKEGDRAEIDAAFEAAHEQEIPPPVQQYFEIRPFGHYSNFRSFAEARSAIQSDFTEALRMEIPRIFFDPAPVVIDDAMASGAKYDVLMKITDNVEGYAIGILLNDPDASFLEYIGTHHGDDWQKIMGNFEITTASLASEIELF
ncbi:MAG TPA: hypothetical protein VMV70_03790 [Gallionella sp.]|nr:hypothetical protein [Gallionella sp.]